MKVYKFGGASVKSADAVRNTLNIISLNDEKLVIIISAMGKMTNAFETLVSKYFKTKNYNEEFELIYNFHLDICKNLFSEKSEIYPKINNIFDELKQILSQKPNNDFDKEYDKIVCFGEIISTMIVSEFLTENNINNTWVDARKIIKTDSNFRAASVNFEETDKMLSNVINFSKSNIFIIQGFIGSNKNNLTTTLGREGSDYTAAVVANLMNAESLTLWKDVAGVYNADPKLIENVTKIEKLSFREATELAYFGAKIIHPKTAKPLMQKNINLIIKSFLDYNQNGTIVGDFKQKIEPNIPVYIVSPNQILITIMTNDFDFVDEGLYEKIYNIFNNYKTKINLMQNSALTLTICFDYNHNNFEELITNLKTNFSIRYNENLTLITIRHYTDESIKTTIKNKKIYLEQKNRLNAFYLVEQ